MRKVRSALSLFLSLLVIFSIWFAASDDIKAADGTFTNVKYEQGLVSWDAVPNVTNGYSVLVYRHDTGKCILVLSTTGKSFDLNQALIQYDLNDMLADVELSAHDTQGNKYHWEGSFYVNYVTMNKLKNVVFDEQGLRWTHNTSNVTDTEVSYTVTVNCEGIKNYFFTTTETSIPASRIAVLGKHDYTIDIKPKAQGYKSIPYTAVFENVTISSPESLQGLAIDADMVYWDEYPKADYYMLYFSMVNASGDRKYYDKKIYADSAFYAPYILNRFTNWAFKDQDIPEQDVQLYIAPYKYSEQLAPFVTTQYHYKKEPVKKFPISIYGVQLDSSMDLTEVLHDFTYYPGTNSIFFNSLDMHNAKDIISKRAAELGMDMTKPFISSTEDLTVYGYADLYTDNEAIVCTKDINIVHSNKSYDQLKIHTQKSGAIKGNNIYFGTGGIDINCATGTAVIAKGNITVAETKSDIYLTTNTESESEAALFANDLILEGRERYQSETGGYFDKNQKTIITAVGNWFERKVRFFASDIAPSPTPTSRPATPTPTASPTATKAPTTAPAKPTKAPTGKPSKPTAIPTVTAAPSESKAQIMEFIKRIYIYVLDREPEEEGGAFWTDELYAFRRTGAEVAQGFIFSPEFESRGTTDEEFVTILYKTFFGRDPESEGLAFWLSQLSTGTMDRVTVANGFIYSQEWADTCASYGIRSGGDLKPTGAIPPTSLTYAFVERMYTTAMGRSYDEEGRQYWASALANFEVTGESVGAFFFLSDEMNSYGLSDSEFISRLYLTFMDREPDEEGLAYWTGFLAADTQRSDVVFGFTRSQEFTDKCIEARILPY